MKISDTLKTRPSDSSLPWSWIGAIALCSLVVVLIFWRVIPSGAQVNEGSDYLYFYEPVAKNLAAGNGLVTNAGAPAFVTKPFPAARFFATGSEK